MKANNMLTAMRSSFRSKYRTLGLVSGISVLFLCGGMQTASAAEEKEGETMEQHGAHEHGAARMTMAVTDKGLDVSLESPAANLFGFEHNAGSDEEHHTVHQTVKTLQAGETLLVISEAAECELKDVSVESSVVAHHKAEKHGEEGHDHDEKHEDGDKHDDHEKHEDGDKHDDHEKHEDGDKHDDHEKHEDGDKHDDHEGHDHDEASHSDVDASWTFTCKHPEKITSVETGFFAAFPDGFEKLDVEWLTADKAGAVKLEKDQVITFEP
uniref:DUF2796 domain-containing protein n=1 Tax=uncultured Thiotrichaceae bacterium TaxID=298394 RepID=A0A6S6TZE3_9GAMM|nr:MAG: DUF2796 domain-containing protein [uncultured Thiotrichaceae bacterium]